MKNFLSKPTAFINSFNLRTRLILGNLIVTFLAVAGLGFYVYYRAQQNNAFLIQQLGGWASMNIVTTYTHDLDPATLRAAAEASSPNPG